ncbi:DUF6680 family protein [Tropicimonas sp. IMCC6043]|uniref:DUF6680 family protein n=1 Tax=Tropicimonas sp. IMCC6043 TaxID=2510645 RepID=UPI00101BDCD8|nr:DUF6680 family protein [Tropicimonas sp. IMCC6043]RYH10394.1 hypothetical protein EU800_08915 [Tropicimonas sp. IMCC6043]
MSSEFWITTVAIVLGPILAVLISRQLQVRDRERERKLYVLRSLLSTRKAQLSQDRVMALNLIEIEFAGKKKILEKFNDLMQTYSDRQKWESGNANVLNAVNEEVDRKSVLLIDEIARDLGYKFDQIKILSGGYYPKGLGVAEEQQQIIREFLVGLRQGKLLLPVGVVDFVQTSGTGDSNGQEASENEGPSA